MLRARPRYTKCNRHGNGSKTGEGHAVFTFQKRKLFLTNSSNSENDEKTPASMCGTSRSRGEGCLPSGSGVKRKVGSKTTMPCYDKPSAAENSVKRTKNEKAVVDDSNKEDGKTTVEESLFSNDLLLRTIFANLKGKHLKSCRQVNRLWNFEATKMLLKRDNLEAIKISNDTVTLRDAAAFKRSSSLQDFRNIVTNSRLFPATNFVVSHYSLSSGTTVVDFFRENGHFVKSFSLRHNYYEPSKKDIKTRANEIVLLAAVNFSNLETLEVELIGKSKDTPTTAEMENALANAPLMAKLHTLKVRSGSPSHVISLIMKKANNLKNIYLLTGERGWSELLKLGSVIPYLRNINLQFSQNSSPIQRYENVLKEKPQFSTIAGIDVESCDSLQLENVGRVLTQLFHLCSESLTQILGVKCLGHIPGLGLSVFPNVKQLEIKYSNVETPQNDPRSRAPLLPSSVNLAEVFPNLISMEWEFSHDVYVKPGKILLESLTPLFSVRHLKVKWGERYIPELWVEKFCYLFPNVTSARFCKLISDAGYEFIWKLSKLEKLHLVIGSKPRFDLRPSLDSAFTGFSLETVKDLAKKDLADLHLSAEKALNLRIKPCIADLKNLRKLSLCLLDACTSKDWEDLHVGEKNVEVIFDPGYGKTLLQVGSRSILSYVSKRFGFDLCPRLNSKVSVAFSHYTRLADNVSDSDETEDSESEYSDTNTSDYSDTSGSDVSY